MRPDDIARLAGDLRRLLDDAIAWLREHVDEIARAWPACLAPLPWSDEPAERPATPRTRPGLPCAPDHPP